MEIVFVKSSWADVISKLRDVLAREGFELPDPGEKKNLMVAHRKKRWLINQGNVSFEFSVIGSTVTRIGVTASIQCRNNLKAEKKLIEKIITMIRN